MVLSEANWNKFLTFFFFFLFNVVAVHFSSPRGWVGGAGGKETKYGKLLYLPTLQNVLS